MYIYIYICVCVCVCEYIVARKHNFSLMNSLKLKSPPIRRIKA